MLFLTILLAISSTERIEYAKYSHEHFLPGNVKNELAGTSGDDSTTLWITSPRCSQEWVEEIVQEHGDKMRELEFITVECWERKANTPPFKIEL